MSLTLAIALSVATLFILGGSLLVFPSFAEKIVKRFPHSRVASVLCFGSALIWFLINIWRLSPADFGDERVPIFIGCMVVGVLAFRFAPDFLALRGLCALMLLAASSLLRAGFMKYDVPGIYFQTGLVYLGIMAALIFAGQPWLWRDGSNWLFAKRRRVASLAGVALTYGFLLIFVAVGAARRDF